MIPPKNRPNPSLTRAAANNHRPQQSHFTHSPPRPSQPSQTHPTDVLSALQQRVRALEAELNAARGEVSIIRANSTKEAQKHSEEVTRLKKLNAEQIQRQERILDAAVAAEKSAATELQFLQQDMREVATRTKPAYGGGGGRVTTPKKGMKWVADGFDEMEIVSPNKRKGAVALAVGERTPTKGKRKRAVDSPVTALETHTDSVPLRETTPAVVHQIQVLSTPAPPFEFLQLVLDHAAFHHQPPTFDTLSRFSFPSDQNTSLSTLIFHKLPMMGNPHRPMQLLVDFCEQIIRLWMRCVEETLWEPVKYLVSLVAFTFQLQSTAVAPLVIPSLTAVAQSTIRTLAEWRHRLPDGDTGNEEYAFLSEHIDTSRIMALLYTAALAAATWIPDDEPMLTTFWSQMSLDSVTLLLTPKQPAEDIIYMLDLLATSALQGSVGPIDDKEAVFSAGIVIERVSAKLTEMTRKGTGEGERRGIRLAALRALLAFARVPFGAGCLAEHENALPRLVTCLSHAIDSLYDQTIPPIIFSSSPSRASPVHPSIDLYQIISHCIILLHALVTGHKADISSKLATSHGGSQRYLIALGRLTFAEEDLVFEVGIEGEVVEMAHELLEMAVTPDEGEILSEAFGA